MYVAEIHAGSTAPSGRPRRHPFLGGLLVKDRLINEAQLERALALQEQAEPRPLLGQLLVDQKLLTPHELKVVLAKYRREHLLGDILVERMHDALLRRNQALERSLAQLEERQASLLRDRELMLERVESALRQLRS